MVKKVGSDQVILFSLPVKKKHGQGTDNGMPGWNRSLCWSGISFRPVHLTIHRK